MLHFQLDMEPISWAPARMCKTHAYSPHAKEKKITTQNIRWLMSPLQGPILGFVVLHLDFIFPLPKSASKSQRSKMLSRGIYPTKKDCTNMQKFIEDCLKNVAFEDDRYVVDVHSKKYYGDVEQGKIIINVYSVEEYKEVENR